MTGEILKDMHAIIKRFDLNVLEEALCSIDFIERVVQVQ